MIPLVVGSHAKCGCLQVHSSTYRAFDSINYPPLATLGVDVDWNMSYLLKVPFLSTLTMPFRRAAIGSCRVAI